MGKKKDKKKDKDREKPDPEQAATDEAEAAAPEKQRLSRKEYERELERLQVELVILQDWVKHEGLKIVVIFEGRDAAGKGGIIKRIMERVSPRIFRVVALPAPSDRERTQLYYQRYIQHLPAAGEVVLFDRSWYNRAGVERVMGFCTEAEYQEFLSTCPGFEAALVRSGIQLIKYWLTVSNDEQETRFRERIKDGRKRWKLSPMDLEARRRWYDYSHARDAMMAVTDTAIAPWYIVPSNDQRLARLNCISHLLGMIPYKDLPDQKVKLPPRSKKGAYDDEKALRGRRFIPQLY
jgi:polyphosphate kinase 2